MAAILPDSPAAPKGTRRAGGRGRPNLEPGGTYRYYGRTAGPGPEASAPGPEASAPGPAGVVAATATATRRANVRRMEGYGADVFTEPDGDPDTLAHLGPLRPLAGTWEGTVGADEHPVAAAMAAVAAAMAAAAPPTGSDGSLAIGSRRDAGESRR